MGEERGITRDRWRDASDVRRGDRLDIDGPMSDGDAITIAIGVLFLAV
jgi:hypothetical protein